MLFYQALALFAEGLILWVVLGAAAAALALVGVGYAVFKLGRQLPLKPLLISGASILLLLSVAFAGNAVRSLQEVDVIGATPIEGDWARLPIFIAELTGIHPTVEGIAVQASLLAVYVLGGLYVFAWRPARQRARLGAEEARATEPVSLQARRAPASPATGPAQGARRDTAGRRRRRRDLHQGGRARVPAPRSCCAQAVVPDHARRRAGVTAGRRRGARRAARRARAARDRIDARRLLDDAGDERPARGRRGAPSG